MKAWGSLGLAVSSLVASASAQGINLDINDPSSLKAAAKIAARGMMTYYTGDKPGQVPGLLPKPYYWWETGGMMGALIAYSTLTGDTQYDDKVKEAMLFQIGENKNYMPSNQTSDLGNDDQSFWAFAAMDAAEMDFSNPSSDYPSWVALAQAVFNSQVPKRWDTQKCGGGLRWQIFPFNAGYDYKNTISTGGLFQLSARLARYTGNQTYADWADKTYNWLWNSKIMNHGWYIWDGTSVADNCATARELFWSYNVGTMIMGAAYMYDYSTGAAKGQWQDRLTNLLHNGSTVFFVQSAGLNKPAKQPPANGGIMAEVACEFPEPQTCNYDQPSFKAYTARWLKVTTLLAPFTKDYINPLLQKSAVAAAQSCAGNGAPGQNTCGRRWYQTGWDGKEGVGEQMSAMSIFVNNLDAKPPVTQKAGGTSKGDATAGGDADDDSVLSDPVYTRPMTAADKAGASILTILSLALCSACTAFMIL